MKSISIQLFATLILVFAIKSANSQQWVYHKDFPVNVAPVDIDSNNDGTLFMLTLDNRLFYKPLNGNWAELLNGWASGGSGFSPISPLCISVHKSSNLLVVGDAFSGGIFTTSNFGLNWNQTFLTTHPNTGFHETILELTPIFNNNIFFGASLTSTLANQVIRYSNSGASGVMLNYTAQYDPAKSAAELFITSNGTLLIGTQNSGIITSTNNGNSFQQSNQSQHQIYRFTEDQNGRVYALGYNIGLDNNFIIYSDDYENWFSLNVPAFGERYTTIYSNTQDNTLWVGSENGIYQASIPSISWDDMTLNNQNFWAIEIIGDNNGGLFSFSIEHISQSFNQQEFTWVSQIAGLSGTATQLAFGDDDRMFAANNYFSNNVSFANSSSESWNNVNLGGTIVGISDLYVRPEGKIFANTVFSLKRSLNNGESYSDITPPDMSGFFHRFYVGEAGALFMVKTTEINTIYWSQNDGDSWEPLATFPPTFEFFLDPIGSISQDSNGVIYVTMDIFDFENGNTVHYTTDNGQTWLSQSYLNLNLSGQGIHVFSKNEQTFTVMYSGVYRFDYSAIDDNFESINLPNVFSNEQLPLSSFSINSAGDFFVFGYDLYSSNNDGETWINLGKPAAVTTANIEGITFDSDDFIYLITSETILPENRGIYKYIPLGTSVQEFTNNDVLVFPNPAKDYINVQSNNQISNSANLINMKGQIIPVQVENGLIDLKLIPPGIYILKVLSSDKVLTTKVVVE
jgi:hypothetical protein